MPNRKRKHGASPTAGDPDDGFLHVQAHEADLRRNSMSAKCLESNGSNIGEALIKHSTVDNSEIWLDRCVRNRTPPSINPVRSAH